MEEKITFESGPCRLEGYWQAGTANRGVVITHPHPLYGGTMHNPVVEIVQNTYQEHGYATLRFNFRGVGSSQGHYDNGAGEQGDVRAAVAFVRDKAVSAIDLAGYSFGAWVNAQGIERFELADRLVMVSPPAGFINFDFLEYSPKIKLVIVGDRDDIAGYDAVKKLVPKWNPEAVFRVIEGADHFYGGYTGELITILHEFLERIFLF